MPVPDGAAEAATLTTPGTESSREARQPGELEDPRGVPAFAWLTAVAVVATAVPAFVRLPYNVPGLQSLTPQKFLLPLVALALAFHLWRRRGGPVLTPLLCTAGGLFLWLLVSVLANRQYEFTYNVRAWSWLSLAFVLAVAAQEMGTRPSSRRLLGLSLLAAVTAVAVLGFVELLNISSLDPFFQLFRPNWIGLGLHGPGPDTVLDLHAYTGGRMRLMSTLSNDTGWVLALGSVAFAGLCLFGDLHRSWQTRLTPAAAAAGYVVVLLALLLSLSRSSILVAGVGLLTLLATASIRWPRLRRRVLVVAVASACVVAVQTFSNSVFRTKFFGLASADAWTTGMVASAPRAIPADERAPAPLPVAKTPVGPGATAAPAAPVAATRPPAPTPRPPAPVPPPSAPTPRPPTPAPRTPAPTPPPPTPPAGASMPALPRGAQTPPSAVPAAPALSQAAGRVQDPASAVPRTPGGDASGVGAWSVTQRVLMARAAVAMIAQNPVFGVGFANFRTRLYEPGRYATIFEVGDKVADVQDPHNFFLWISAAGGLPALVLVLVILGLTARAVVRTVTRGGEDVGLALTLGVSWLTLVGFMLMGFTLMTPVTQAVFALLVGMTGAIDRAGSGSRPSADRA
jgi:hypothetical protein